MLKPYSSEKRGIPFLPFVFSPVSFGPFVLRYGGGKKIRRKRNAKSEWRMGNILEVRGSRRNKAEDGGIRHFVWPVPLGSPIFGPDMPVIVPSMMPVVKFLI